MGVLRGDLCALRDDDVGALRGDLCALRDDDVGALRDDDVGALRDDDVGALRGDLGECLDMEWLCVNFALSSCCCSFPKSLFQRIFWSIGGVMCVTRFDAALI